jgi:O-antigen biosynthesis protein
MTWSKKTNTPLRLEPESGVSILNGRLQAVSLPIWLRLEPIHAIPQDSWIKLRYSSSFFDEPVRPLIRFVTASGKVFTQAMNGPVLGTAEWIGRVPDGVVSVSVSPARRLGPFSFRVDSVETVSRHRMLQAGMLSDMPWALWALRSRLLNAREESWQALKYAAGGTRLERYDEWRARLYRPLDLKGIDRPRRDWANGPNIHFLLSLDNATPQDLLATVHSLRSQVQERWFLHAVASDRTPAPVLSLYAKQMEEDYRFLRISQGDKPGLPQEIANDDWVSIIDSGDVLEDYALALVTETLAEQPDLTVVYSDEDRLPVGGTFAAPVLKPDWSPIFYEAMPYVGRLTCLRYGDLISHAVTARDLLTDETRVLSQVLAKTEAAAIGHIRRVLYHRRQASPPPLRNRNGAVGTARPPDVEWPEVSIVIPTRDHAELLSECLRGLEETTDYPSFNIVLLDNGSTQSEACALLSSLQGNPRFKILARPGPFNYSRLCNEGASQTKAPVLVFLNNDLQFFEPGWLKAMVRWAVRPEIGVVGAKLLFPNRTIQHAGVVLGMGGLAGHVYWKCPADEQGYLHQLEAPRELYAVTAACIAIGRSKFEAVGGFDGENLPSDLNDIDLCLRVRESGLTNLCTPEARVIHVQSASRGTGKNAFERYRQEREYFASRWIEAIRDDPYFHPAFSLFSQRPALGG